MSDISYLLSAFNSCFKNIHPTLVVNELASVMNIVNTTRSQQSLFERNVKHRRQNNKRKGRCKYTQKNAGKAEKKNAGKAENSNSDDVVVAPLVGVGIQVKQLDKVQWENQLTVTLLKEIVE